jgi:hypothetical protein
VDGVDLAGGKAIRLECTSPIRTAGRVTLTPASASRVKITLHNALGQEVMVVADRWFAARRNEVGFDVRNLGSGVYFCRVLVDDDATTRPLVVIR